MTGFVNLVFSFIQYFPVFTVSANLSNTYLPAVIGGNFEGLSSLRQDGNVSTVSS
jgi:hypothetical protein